MDEINENGGQEDNLREVVKNTQMLMRNQMINHKKFSKEIHTKIKNHKKTIELYKEKISKLLQEKEKLDSKASNRFEDDKSDSLEIQQLKNQIIREIADKNEFDEKINEIKEDFLIVKNNMGGLNAAKQVQERYEKHIKILENRLDKANQKFNDSIEHDKILRDEIDKLRKERFFFENIYKKLEKDLGSLKYQITDNLQHAYENYEIRDKNQENFENIKAQMMKKEQEYAQVLSHIANDLNIRNSRKKNIEAKEIQNKNSKNHEEENFKLINNKIKLESAENQSENLQEKYKNLKYKYEKLAEFTEQMSVESFCRKFKNNAQKNYDLFSTITKIKIQAMQLDKEIKELEEEIEAIKKFKSGQNGVEKNNLLNELKTKTMKLVQKQDKYENEYKRKIDEFKQLKNLILNFHISLECSKLTPDSNKILMENGVNETNVKLYLSDIENMLKIMQKFFEMEFMEMEDFNVNRRNDNTNNKEKMNPKQVSDNMKIAFASMEISKIKTFEHIKNAHKVDEIKLENIIEYSSKIADELLDVVKKANANEKKAQNKYKKLK